MFRFWKCERNDHMDFMRCEYPLARSCFTCVCVHVMNNRDLALSAPPVVGTFERGKSWPVVKRRRDWFYARFEFSEEKERRFSLFMLPSLLSPLRFFSSSCWNPKIKTELKVHFVTTVALKNFENVFRLEINWQALFFPTAKMKFEKKGCNTHSSRII